jgi:hypothetical protein
MSQPSLHRVARGLARVAGVIRRWMCDVAAAAPSLEPFLTCGSRLENPCPQTLCLELSVYLQMTSFAGISSSRSASSGAPRRDETWLPSTRAYRRPSLRSGRL